MGGIIPLFCTLDILWTIHQTSGCILHYILTFYSVHPYIFFNRDTSSGGEVYYDSMTFVGFNFQQVGKIVNLIDLQLETIEDNIMTDGLYRWMRESGVELRQDPKTWTK